MVFKSFPVDRVYYFEDIHPIIEKTINRYGLQEWRSAVLTNEIHGHLGIYAVIGVKMGIFSLEALGADAGEVQVVSLAGAMPPVSCLNDGLQISTGATFGHGLIESSSTDNPQPEATFSAGDKRIRIRLKRAVSDMIIGEIAEAITRWGHSPEYWEYVRRLAIKYWCDLDRNEIFEIDFY